MIDGGSGDLGAIRNMYNIVRSRGREILGRGLSDPKGIPTGHFWIWSLIRVFLFGWDISPFWEIMMAMDGGWKGLDEGSEMNRMPR